MVLENSDFVNTQFSPLHVRNTLLIHSIWVAEVTECFIDLSLVNFTYATGVWVHVRHEIVQKCFE